MTFQLQGRVGEGTEDDLICDNFQLFIYPTIESIAHTKGYSMLRRFLSLYFSVIIDFGHCCGLDSQEPCELCCTICGGVLIQLQA